MAIDLTKKLKSSYWKNFNILFYQFIFQNVNKDRAVLEKDERTLFQEYLCTDESAGGNKLMIVVAEERIA